jgi:hypothetical protein
MIIEVRSVEVDIVEPIISTHLGSLVSSVRLIPLHATQACSIPHATASDNGMIDEQSQNDHGGHYKYL